MTRPLYDLPPARERNARLWPDARGVVEAGSGTITPVGEIRNAATRADGLSALAGGGLILASARSDLKKPVPDPVEEHSPEREAAPRKRSQEPPEAAQETTMGRDTKENVEARRETLRKALPGTGADLRARLATEYAAFGPTTLNFDLKKLGATRDDEGVWSIGGKAEPKKRRIPAAIEAPPATVPVRPSLADAARAAMKQANDEGAPLYLEHEFVAALHGRLVEAGL